MTATRRLASMASSRCGLVFPGGGLFFWWQAGAITGLARRLDMQSTPLAGASAGALAATLAACEVDMENAFERALALSNEAGVFERGAWGLYGVWGDIVRNWLEELLPHDAAQRCQDRVNLLVRQPVLQYPPVRALEISSFSGRADLIDCCMASVHVPLFLDRRLTTEFRGARCFDGSLEIWGLPKVEYPMPEQFSTVPVIRVSPFKDPRMRARYSRTSDFLRLSDVDAIREMMIWGQTFAEEGKLQAR